MATTDVPESRFDPGATLVPETPAGYADPTEFRYSMPVLALGALAFAPLAIVAFGAVLWWAQGPAAVETVATVTETDDGVSFVVDLGPVLGLFVVAVVVTTVVHELVHGLVLRRYGYAVSYGFTPQMGAFYAAAFHQFVPRERLLPVALAPLASLSLVGLVLLFVPAPWVAVFGFQALVFNAVGAVGDVYIAVRAFRLPRGTLFYDSDIRHSYLFSPAGGSVGQQ